MSGVVPNHATCAQASLACLQDLLGWISSNTDSLLLSKDKYVEPEPLQ